MSKTITVNLLGSSVSREMFADKEAFEIGQCIINAGLFSLCSPKLSEECLCTAEDFPDTADEWRQSAVADMNKTVFDCLKEKKSDYLVLDLGSVFAKKILKVKMKDDDDPYHFTYITKTRALEEHPAFLEQAPFEVLDTFGAEEDELLTMALIYQYAELLREHFDPDKIIIAEVRPMERYIAKDGHIRYFPPEWILRKKAQYLKDMYAILEEVLPEAHVIPFPETEVLCRAGHCFHYTAEYGQYLLNCVRGIANSRDREMEQVIIGHMKQTCTDLLRERYASTVGGRYTLQNKAAVSAESIRHGEHIFIFLNAEGGTGAYHYDVYIRKLADSNWRVLTDPEKTVLRYRPICRGLYQVCIKVTDGNGISQKQYLKFAVN